jgi:hypothetical protein
MSTVEFPLTVTDPVEGVQPESCPEDPQVIE